MNRYFHLLSGLVFVGTLAAQMSWSSQAQAQQQLPDPNAPTTATPTLPPPPPPPSAYPPPVQQYPQGQYPQQQYPQGYPQQQYPQGYPPPVVQVPPPPPPALPHGYHLHDGFYLRMSLGAGSMKSTSKPNNSSTSGSDVETSGTHGAFDLMLGGTLSPGFVLGGAILANSASDPKVKQGSGPEETANDTTLSMSLVGPMTDIFFNPREGFHVGGMIGAANLTTSYHVDTSLGSATYSDRTSSGWGGALWLGYDAWVSDNWSLGGLLRYAGAKTESDKDSRDTKESTNSITLMFTALYH